MLRAVALVIVGGAMRLCAGMTATSKPSVAIIGGGSFGSAMTRVVARSVAEKSDRFDPTVRWWVRREACRDEIMETRTNARYFAGAIPDNVAATCDAGDAVYGASVVVIAVPGEFFSTVLPAVAARLDPDAQIVSLCKSLKLGRDATDVVFASDLLKEALRTERVSALSGPNLYADMVAENAFAEATLGYAAGHEADAAVAADLFTSANFYAAPAPDIRGVEAAGA